MGDKNNSKRLIIFSDGGAFNNPGPAGIGIIFYNQKGEELNQISKYIGFKTNNQAEYSGVLEALKYAYKKYKPQEIQFFLDSKLVVEQLKGNYKIKNNELKLIYNEIKIFQLNFPIVLYNHIPREKNLLADKLVKKAIKAGIKKGKP